MACPKIAPMDLGVRSPEGCGGISDSIGDTKRVSSVWRNGTRVTTSPLWTRTQ
jgi:hypothetical protein